MTNFGVVELVMACANKHNIYIMDTISDNIKHLYYYYNSVYYKIGMFNKHHNSLIEFYRIDHDRGWVAYSDPLVFNPFVDDPGKLVDLIDSFISCLMIKIGR